MHQSDVCTNCSHSLATDDRFCGHCGQRAVLHRFTMRHLSHEVSHAITHADATIFTLMRDVLIRPATVLHDYIVLGKRKAYFNPFTAVLLLGGLLLLVTSMFNPYRMPELEPKMQAARAEMEKDPTKAMALAMFDRSQRAAQFIEKNSKLLMLLSIPISAWIFWLGYRRTGLNYAEHVVAATFLTCGLTIFFSLFMMPMMGVFKQTTLYNWVVPLSLVFQWVYFGVAYGTWAKRFQPTYPASRAWVFSLLNIVVWSLLSAGGVFVYVLAGMLT